VPTYTDMIQEMKHWIGEYYSNYTQCGY
jgi:hypothetical protein